MVKLLPQMLMKQRGFISCDAPKVGHFVGEIEQRKESRVTPYF